MTPIRTVVEEIQLEEEVWKLRPENKLGPIRTSAQSCDSVRKQALMAFAERKVQAVLEDKVRKDVFEIMRQKYLVRLEQVFDTNHSVSSIVSSEVASDRRM
ncbi:MAG: hypothetical protein WC747_02340 [Candidatus Babeliales bacterium]